MYEASTPKQIVAPETKLAHIGNRIPQDFFLTSGVGESDITVHAGSFHLALRKAGIERFNIMTYSSILPAIAREIPRNSYRGTHGEVMETIMACADVERSHANNGLEGHVERATAGIIFGWLHNKKTRERYGGLVCEYSGHETEQFAERSLRASLNELHVNGFSDEFDVRNIRLVTRSVVPTKRCGTALVALCFTSCQVPISMNENEMPYPRDHS